MAGSYILEVLDNLAAYKDVHGGMFVSEGTRTRRRPRRGMGLEMGGVFDDEPMGEGLIGNGLIGDGMYGSGMYGSGRKRRAPRRANAFDIGKYSKAIAAGKTKAEAKVIARRK